MRNIVPEITSLSQYIEVQNNDSERLRPACCPYCGNKGLWRHGHYDRKASRKNTSNVQNPIYIYRYFCPHCHRTCSTLPECLPQNRWYLWDIQQVALLLSLIGKSFATIAKKTMLPRHTISRWINNFKEHLENHKEILCKQLNDLDITKDFSVFWLSCLNKVSLSKAMFLYHTAKVKI